MKNTVEQTVLMLFGVSDEEARGKVMRALHRVAGVKEIEVSIYRAEARILHDGRCTPSALEDAVRVSGFAAQRVGPRRIVWPDSANENRPPQGDTP